MDKIILSPPPALVRGGQRTETACRDGKAAPGLLPNEPAHPLPHRPVLLDQHHHPAGPAVGVAVVDAAVPPGGEGRPHRIPGEGARVERAEVCGWLDLLGGTIRFAVGRWVGAGLPGCESTRSPAQHPSVWLAFSLHAIGSEVDAQPIDTVNQGAKTGVTRPVPVICPSNER